ncbi:hypothetical protein BBO99_00001380 [Phytophthora kernoviae]|uniref:Vacuolar protein sorting-associated protein 51 homolog n=2 Tax=Phytophthora kernoviae TaxID=325452 RepID=A0A421GZT2_9STRA|nr:hypothetical protein G195_006080 [Phytophthora kernoviae 00238/432]KAG2526501.1 hypothetical protein JM18_004347 [Phytophthora kernoviae]KAG2530529.1 hypothetical protein JM16_000868 [Phytophthora kernoviae]RLN26149.1 hypothetical protein BBI17_001249 [Phytophthora kernoviae]RLN84369.1 hypothetical protein BBO99_00001380 [Phytophthora kernoviae]
MARMQELLSNYYGLQDQESREQQLRNIDSQGFDPKTYVKELLEARGLNDLLATDDQLIKEIKELDTNMQMLVYENYNKFISATDTIRKMKNNVASMEDEVSRVVASMDTITAKSESISVALAPHRSKVEKLIGVRRLLKRFEFIFELPQRLNTYVAGSVLSCTVVYFGRADWTIQLEAEKIIQQLERLLKKRMLDSTLESEEICETVVLLDQLDACNDEIRDQFLEWHQTYFERVVAVYKGKTEEVLEALNDDDLTADIVDSEYFVFMRVLKLFVSQGQFYDFLKWFNASVLQYAEPKRAFAPVDGSFGARSEEQDSVAIPWLEPTPQFLLFLACMCHELSAEGIGECVRGLIECLPAPMSPSKTAARDSARSNHMSQLDVTHMIEVTRQSSAELLQHVAKQYGNQLCIIVHNGVAATSWSDMDEEPRSVQEMMAAVVEATFRFGKEVALALGDERSALVGNNSRTASRDFRRRASALRSRNGGAMAASSGMQLDVERIFARKIQIFPAQMDLTADSFVQIMLKLCIKAFSEWVRTLELSKFGLQQIQLNAEFLRSTLMHVVAADEGEEEIESLLSDLLSSARARATEDVLMDQSNVVAIVSTRSTQVLSRRG